MRSKIFVPGARPELFNKALMSLADAISIDMEDSVVEDKKELVRQTINEFLLSDTAIATHKKIIVRCNSVDSIHFKADLKAVLQPRLDMLNIPKVESCEDVINAVALIEAIEATNGVVQPVQLLVNIETPKGLRNALQISTSHKRVVGLQLGLNDFFDSCRIDRSDISSIHTVMLMVRIAASEAGINVYDGAYPDIENPLGFKAETEMACRLGYNGKSCIHPKQIEMVNGLFTPNNVEIAKAEQIVKAAQSAQAQGVGVFTFEGKMIDSPAIKRAMLLLKEYKQLQDTKNS